MRNPTATFGALTVCSILVVAASPALGQSGAIQQTDTAKQRSQLEQSAENVRSELAPELYPDEASDVGPQYVVVYKPRKRYFEAMVDAQYFYTDNVFLSDDSEVESDVLVTTVQLALAPTPYDLGGGKFAPRIGYQHQWFMFGLLSDKELSVFNFETLAFETGELDLFNFNQQTVFADGRWTRDNWVAGIGFNYARLMDSSDYNQFYREYVPRWGLQRLFPLSDNAALSAAYEGDYRFTDTEIVAGPGSENFNDRTDHSLILSYTQNLCRQALVQPYYRFQYTRFTDLPEVRNDYLNSVGLALYCFFTENVNLRAFVSYDILETTGSGVPDYNKLDAGGGINLSIRF